MTGWIVALVGLKFQVEALAMPLVGLGVLLRLTREGRRRGAFGTALAGFGLLFMGIALLQHWDLPPLPASSLTVVGPQTCPRLPKNSTPACCIQAHVTKDSRLRYSRQAWTVNSTCPIWNALCAASAPCAGQPSRPPRPADD